MAIVVLYSLFERFEIKFERIFKFFSDALKIIKNKYKTNYTIACQFDE